MSKLSRFLSHTTLTLLLPFSVSIALGNPLSTPSDSVAVTVELSRTARTIPILSPFDLDSLSNHISPAVSPRSPAIAPLRAAGITILSHGVIWGFNRYVQNADYADINLNTIKANLTGPWVWDQNTFSVNHLGHPYQGSLYYVAARGQGIGFFGSSITALAGSLSWELLMESEAPSKNDLIATPIGGIALGEMLIRLSRKAFRIESNGGKVLGTLLHPVDGLNRALGWSAPFPADQPAITGKIDIGGGGSFGKLRVEGDRPGTPPPFSRSLYSYRARFAPRRPFSHPSPLPLRYFSDARGDF